MSPLQHDPAYLSLAAMPNPKAAAAPKVDLTDLADPTKTPNQSGSFSGFLSAINPLQHIPVIGSIYRAITGDVPAPAARVLGGALLGGPIGIVLAAANAIFEQDTGHEVGGQVLAFLGPSKPKTAEPTTDIAAGFVPPVTAEASVNPASLAAAPMVADTPISSDIAGAATIS